MAKKIEVSPESLVDFLQALKDPRIDRTNKDSLRSDLRIC